MTTITKARAASLKRMALGVSQNGLAVLMGRPQSYIAAFEAGRRNHQNNRPIEDALVVLQGVNRRIKIELTGTDGEMLRSDILTLREFSEAFQGRSEDASYGVVSALYGVYLAASAESILAETSRRVTGHIVTPEIVTYMLGAVSVISGLYKK